MKKTTKALLTMTCLGLGASHAANISVNFTDEGNNGFGNADITELAGVVESGGWETADANGARNDTNLSALRADDGGTLVTTTATLSIGPGFGGYFNSPSGFNTGTALFNNGVMDTFIETDNLGNGGTISFTNLTESAGATYDVYIYISRQFGNTGPLSVTLGGVTKFIEGEDNTGPFSEANYGTLAAAQAATATGQDTAGNYMLFTGLSSADLTVNFVAESATERAGINGIQIIGTSDVIPEPSSTALIGLGGLALIMRRRK